MKFCVNEACTMKADFATDVKAHSQAGFQAIDLWLPKIDTFCKKSPIEDAASLLKDHGVEAVSACGVMGPLSAEGEKWKEIQTQLAGRLEQCQRLACPILVVYPETFSGEPDNATYEKVVSNFQEMAETAARFEVILALEFAPNSNLVDSMSTALEIIRQVDHPNVKLLFDVFLFWKGLSRMSDLDLLQPGELVHVHLEDVRKGFREVITNEDRVFPGEGEAPLKQIKAQFDRVGYDGYYSFEYFTQAMWEKDPFEVAKELREVADRTMSELG